MSAIEIPHYIEKTGVQNKPLRYEFETCFRSEIWDKSSDKLLRDMASLAPRAMLALCAGIGEWILWRVNQFERYKDPYLLNQAVWASVVEFRYVDYEQHVFKKETNVDPVDIGTLDEVSKLLKNSVRQISRKTEGCFIGNKLAFLANHVIKHGDFNRWLKYCFAHLKKHFKIPDSTYRFFRDKDIDRKKIAFDWGLPVPKEVLDPDFDFTMDKRAELLDNFLRRLDYSQNRFLRTPFELKKLGFEGTPYTYTPNKE